MNYPLAHIDPGRVLFWLPAVIGALIGGPWNLLAHRRNDQNSGYGLKYFFQGFFVGAVIGGTWSLGLLLISMNSLVVKIAGWIILVSKAINVVMGLASCAGNFRHCMSVLTGKILTDKKKGFIGGLLEAISRNTWEAPQTWLGLNFSHARNVFRGVDRVEHFDGSCYVINELNDSTWGVSLGSYIHISSRIQVGDEFENSILANPIFMHEYGHKFQGRIFGPFYLIIIGIPSLLSSYFSKQAPDEISGVTTHDFKPWEMGANRNAARYFRKYGIDWERDRYRGMTIETYYPTKKR